MNWHRFDKPEYFFRPATLWQRLRRPARQGGLASVSLPFGLPLRADPQEVVGRAILTLGLYDLVLSETLWRLADPGETALDVGANIGYVTALLARRVGAAGRVHSFEPHPEVLACLRDNLGLWRGFAASLAAVEIHPVALGSQRAAAQLVEPEEFAGNFGTATLAAANLGAGRAFTVQVERLDDELETAGPVGVMKLDVEGHEADVLAGAPLRLVAGSIRDIVFEELGNLPGEVACRLQAHGYTVFTLDRTFFGPRLLPPGRRPRTHWLPTNLLATRDPARARARLASRGWRVLRGC